MTIITMATTKGGAGKTTVAQMIIGAVHQSGYSIGAIDTDENQTLSNWLSNVTSMAIDNTTTSWRSGPVAPSGNSPSSKIRRISSGLTMPITAVTSTSTDTPSTLRLWGAKRLATRRQLNSDFGSVDVSVDG